MIRLLNSYRFYLRLAFYILPPVAFFLAAYLRFYSGIFDLPNDFDPHSYFIFLLLTTLVWVVSTEHYKLATPKEILAGTGARAALLVWSGTYLVDAAALFFYRSATFSRLFVLLSALILVVLVITVRAGLHALLLAFRSNRNGFLHILVVGTDRFAKRGALRLVQDQLAHCKIDTFVQLPGQEIEVEESRVVTLDNLNDEHVHGIDEIVIALPPAQLSALASILPRLEHFCVPVRAILDFGEGVILRERIFEFADVQMLDLTTTPAESVGYIILKRTFDCFFSFLLILLTAPVMLVIAAAIRLASPGPILFTQERVGLNGKSFKMYKFRTMRVAAATDSSTRWTQKNDPRCTRLGVFLRCTSLDELPQFFNVLKGDMSVVGPRPERPHFVKRFQQEIDRYSIRHRLKVGITGWAQVNGWRGDTSIGKRIEHDLYYLEHWSLGFDLRIIFMTVFSVLTRRNAY